MRLPTRPRAAEATSAVTGTIRMERRTGSLLRRLRPGDIAVIDHLDLDRASAEALVASGVVAVVNASPFISGRHPNRGPELLAGAGVLMLDDVGSTVFAQLRDGASARIQDGAVVVGAAPVVSGRELGPEDVAVLMEHASRNLASQLETFTHNTCEFLRRQPELLLHGQGVPDVATPIEGRPVVVVAPGDEVREDLRRLRRFIREQRPVLVGVNAGADTLVAAGHQPHIVVVGAHRPSPGGPAGIDDGAVSDHALHAAQEVVLHTDRGERLIGAERLTRLGVRHQTLVASGATEDVALLLADVRGAGLIVTVGARATLEDLLDPQRAGISSTFLTRLRVGPRLVDARSVPLLYAGRTRLWHLLLLLLVGLLAVAVALATTSVGQEWWSAVADRLGDAPGSIRGLVP
jgi:uncharacterized membrane-anchored protein